MLETYAGRMAIEIERKERIEVVSPSEAIKRRATSWRAEELR